MTDPTKDKEYLNHVQQLRDLEDIEMRQEELSTARDKRALDELEKVANARGITRKDLEKLIAGGHPDGQIEFFCGWGDLKMMTLAAWVRQRRAKEDSK